jgi:outer membrane protein
MKKLSGILSIVAVVAVAALYVVVFVGKSKSTMFGGVASEGSSAAVGGVVYVNLDSLVRGYDMYFDLQKEFEATAKKKDGDFTARSRKFENDARDFQEKVGKGLVTRSQAQQMQEGLERRQQELIELRQQLQTELAEEEAVMLRRIQDNIQKYVLEYNKEKGYSLILSNSNGNVLLYGDPGLNVTAEVLAGLNSKYVKASKK